MARRKASPTQQEFDVELDPKALAAVARFDEEIAARRAERLSAAGGRPVALDCETAGKTLCWPCALDGPEKCLEIHLTPAVHDACVAEARRLAVLRSGAHCHDCAFLRGSHEAGQEGLIARLARQRDAFHCHQGMPLDGRGRTPAEGDYAPDDHRRYPVCAGWAAARANYLARCRAARALPGLRRLSLNTHERLLSVWGVARFDRYRRRVRPELARVARRDLCFWCVTRRRRAVRAELAISQQTHVARGIRIVGELRRRGDGDLVWHRVEGEAGTTPWIPGPAERALDAFAVVLVRAGVRAGFEHGGTREPPPYTRPPKGPRPPRPRSKGRPRLRPAPLLLRAA